MASNRWTQQEPQAPRPTARSGHSMFDDLRGRFVIFGGMDATAKVLDEEWAYTP